MKSVENTIILLAGFSHKVLRRLGRCGPFDCSVARPCSADGSPQAMFRCFIKRPDDLHRVLATHMAHDRAFRPSFPANIRCQFYTVLGASYFHLMNIVAKPRCAADRCSLKESRPFQTPPNIKEAWKQGFNTGYDKVLRKDPGNRSSSLQEAVPTRNLAFEPSLCIVHRFEDPLRFQGGWPKLHPVPRTLFFPIRDLAMGGLVGDVHAAPSIPRVFRILPPSLSPN